MLIQRFILIDLSLFYNIITDFICIFNSIFQIFIVILYCGRPALDICDIAIELGGEDAKILFFQGSVEQRMNSTCAGGTGAFIDQMSTLLNMSLE